MLDIGWSELLLVALVTLVVVGPREIPRVLRSVRGFVARIRSVGADFQGAMDEAARSADIEDLKKEILKEQHDMSDDKLFQEIVGTDTQQQTQQIIDEVKDIKSSAETPDGGSDQDQKDRSL